ncbi:unnamed protein product [Paramecium primaurelia]|uniref:LITAF domain-containing protein n=1 Tax=Paramecium primaurelia TaxID=5886 RepID=A0A8S1JT06_PARPR|nr:unnamed protein product [Paramecium primaurelia]
MLISKTDNDEQQEGVVDSKLPVCPNCGSAKESILEQVPSPASFIISLICLLYCGIWCIFIIPLVFQSTKIIIKRCYYCNSELEKRNYFQLPNINDQILQFRFGNCIIVVSRKYAMILLGIIFIIFFYFKYNAEKEVFEIDLHTNLQWIDFLQYCGKFQFVENGLKARHQFETLFKNKIVSWNGIYVKTKLNYDIQFPYNYMVYIKMDPTESTDDIPDILLGVKSQEYFIDTFQMLEIGQQLHFNAKFISLGSEYNFHILELKQLDIIQENIVDIKQIKKFTLIMDQAQQLKKTKLQDSLKRMIHMYQPKINDNKSKVDQNNVVQMGLSAEQIQDIEQEIEQLQKQLESEEQQINDEQSQVINNDQIENSLSKEENDINMNSKINNEQESIKDSSTKNNLDQQ